MLRSRPVWASRFQDAAFDSSQWLTVLQELADATGSTRAELVGGGSADIPSFNWVTSTDERTLEDFLASGGASPQSNFRQSVDDGSSVLRIIDEDDYAEARRTLVDDGYVDFCEQYGMTFGCQTVLLRKGGGLIGMSLLRSRSDGPTGEVEQKTFAEASVAAAAAVRLQRAIEDQGYHLLAGTFEAMSMPCMVLDGRGAVRGMTAGAEAFFGPDSLLRLDDGQICARDSRMGRQLKLALNAVLGPTAAGHRRVVGCRETGPVLVLDIFRLAARDWSLRVSPKAIVVLRDPRRVRSAATDLLRENFALTGAEAEIAVLLSAGMSREQIAALRGVTAETLRSQLRALYSKTGCSRETELVLLIKGVID